MIVSDELRELADLNLAESTRQHARWLPGYAIEERDGMLFCASGTRAPVAPFNVALRVGRDQTDAQQLIAEAKAFFAARNRGFAIQIRGYLDPDLYYACQIEGFACMSGRAPGMIRTERLAPPTLPSHVQMRPVTLASAHDFVGVSALAYESSGLAPAVCRKALSLPERWLNPAWQARVLYDADQPVCAAAILYSHGIAGIYWVGTVPAARGKGYAEAIMRAVTNEAFDRGARAVVLQASTMGEPIYTRLGYVEMTTYPWFMVPHDG